MTIDLRGLRAQLQNHAQLCQMTPAALVRQAVLTYLAPKSGDQARDLKLVTMVRDSRI